MPLDLKNYLHYLKDPDIPDDENLKASEALQTFFQSFLDLERGVHSVQKCREIPLRDCLQSPVEYVDSKNKRLIRLFNKFTAPHPERLFEKFRN